MKRRKFIGTTGSAALALSTFPETLFAKGHLTIKTASDLNSYLRSLIEVNEPSVDKVIVGDPETVITKIGTAWLPYWATLKEARDQGVNTLVVHEPTFYSHRDLEESKWDFHAAPSPAKEIYLQQLADKKKWIEENGMVIIRCHDVLDKISGFGIPFAFGRALGFKDSDLLRSKTYYNVYGIETRPAIEVARQIATALKSVGQPGVAFYGDENYPVKSVGLGTGCICNPLEFMDLEMDLAIAIDDSVNTWTQTAFARDSGRPLIVVNHGTAEEFGMKELSIQLDKVEDRLECIHFKQGCTYKWVVG